jgi:hypothetical protein
MIVPEMTIPEMTIPEMTIPEMTIPEMTIPEMAITVVPDVTSRVAARCFGGHDRRARRW